MKTLIMLVMLMTADNMYGKKGDLIVDYSYMPSHEHCVKKAVPYARKFLGPIKDVELYIAMCADITEEEDQDPINSLRKIWFGM